jgi:hypothetical protein
MDTSANQMAVQKTLGLNMNVDIVVQKYQVLL